MLHTSKSNLERTSFLSQYTMSELTFGNSDRVNACLSPIWTALAMNQWDEACKLARRAMEEHPPSNDHDRAAILSAWATAELRRGATDMAQRLAAKSLSVSADQHMAHRILLKVLTLRKAFESAYLHLANIPLTTTCASWDQPIPEQEMHTALAAWAWQMGEWAQVAEHLVAAFPAGLAAMPSSLREDWFKLSLYRGMADDAEAAASSLLHMLSESETDDILQTVVRSGWTRQALSLYESAYERKQGSELFRRRLVALNIKEGKLAQAHLLTASAPLKMAV
jgi:tetratricopeptide (TPR) repeat protein